MNQETHMAPEALQTADLDCLLTLALPLALEEEMLDLLRAQRGMVTGFSVLQGQGVGADAPLTTTMERVAGRAHRVLVQVVMRHADVPLLIAHLRAALPSRQVFYWVVPLLECGRLA